MYAVLLAIFTDLVIVGVAAMTGHQWAEDWSAAILVATPGLVIALLQLARTFSLDRAAFIKDYATKFLTDPVLHTTFYDLIYCYDNDSYRTVEEKTCRLLADAPEKREVSSNTRPIFVHLNSLNKGRKEGARFFDPRTIQFSLEEQRLDALLAYFDVIGFFYARGFVRLEDVTAGVGHYLAYIWRSHAVGAYLKLIVEEWARKPAGQAENVPIPFSSLRSLLEALSDDPPAYRSSQPVCDCKPGSPQREEAS